MSDFKRIIELIKEAFQIAINSGINNLLQPGLVKEMIIADILDHKLITTKKGADACDKNDENILYEYISCKKEGAGQFDRMFKEPLEKRKESLLRLSRNKKIYLIIFYKENQIKVKTIYEIDPSIAIKEANRQLDNSTNSISHISFNEKWSIKNDCRTVYNDKT